MKALPLFTVLLSATALAQEPTEILPRMQERLLHAIRKGGDTLSFPRPQDMVVVPGNRVVLLPQDGMPCIVPDSRGIAPMPNAGRTLKAPKAGQIPNAWKKLRSRPEMQQPDNNTK